MRDLLASNLSALLLPAILAAQEVPQRTLADLQRAFEAELSAAMQQAPPPGEDPMRRYRETLARHVAELEQFLEHEARGDDRFNGRLMLVDLKLTLGDPVAARNALDELDVEACPPLILLVAADFAARLGMDPQRGAWIDAALGKEAGLEEQMEIARVLMTLLLEIDRGEAIFDEAMENARTDEDRARVLWFRSIATREREDLAEGAYHEALEALAEQYPGTYYGGVARDRVRAAEMRVGGAPVPFRSTDLEGRPVSLQDYAGKVLLLQFWASWDPTSRELVNPALVRLVDRHGDQGFEILGISLDLERAELERAVAEDGCTWRQVFDGKVWQSDLALRYVVEGLPYLMLIDRQGRIAGMNLFPDSPAGIRELEALVARTVGDFRP